MSLKEVITKHYIPNEAGWYWAKKSKNDKWIPVEVDERGYCSLISWGNGHVDTTLGKWEWSEKISHPDDDNFKGNPKI
jgi:hypothetical protein